MRKIIAGFAISLDGYIEGPNGEYDWIIFDKEQQKQLADYWKKIDAMFYGRKTYEAALAMSAKTKNKSNPFAHMKHYVFSNSLDSLKGNFILIKGDTQTEVQKIKNESGKDIAVFGGADLACSLINSGLVDELVLAVCPILLGAGKSFFSSINKRINLKLKENKEYSSGLVLLTYGVL
jgi:dihydrofolate reductase